MNAAGLAVADTAERTDLPEHIVLYDGTCVLCHRGVRALMALDTHRRLHFAPLQGPTARALGVDWDDDAPPGSATFRYVDNTSGIPVLHERMDGVAAQLDVIDRLPVLARAIRIIPRPIADGLYRIVAATRFALFGRYDGCRLPTRSERAQLLP